RVERRVVGPGVDRRVGDRIERSGHRARVDVLKQLSRIRIRPERLPLEPVLPDAVRPKPVLPDAVAQVSETGQESDLIGLGLRVGASIQRELGFSAGEIAPTPISVLPSKAAAARLYSEGLSKLRKLEIVEGRDLLVKAAA